MQSYVGSYDSMKVFREPVSQFEFAANVWRVDYCILSLLLVYWVGLPLLLVY